MSSSAAVSEAPGPDVRRDDLAVALQAAADAYRESHSFRGPFLRRLFHALRSAQLERQREGP